MMSSKPIIQPLAQGFLSPNSSEKERFSHGCGYIPFPHLFQSNHHMLSIGGDPEMLDSCSRSS